MNRYGLAFLFLQTLVFTSSLFAQHEMTEKEIIGFYENQPSDQPLHFWNNEDTGWHQIILIRHGEPDLKKKGWRNRKQAAAFMQAYDSVGVRPFSAKPFDEKSLPSDSVWCSTLPRASHTAEVLFGKVATLQSDSRFCEFERKALSFFNVKMPLKFWTVGSRVFWVLGANDSGIETFKEAKARAKSNAGFLVDQAMEKETSVLVAHGFHNKYVDKYLQKKGWKQVFSNGSGYGSVKVLVMFQ